MYIWRKRAGPRWMRARNEDLAWRFGSALALVECPGKKHVLLEISCGTSREAQQLVLEFGGSVEKLRGGWLQHFARQTQGKPLRIGSRVIIRSTPDSRRKQRASPARTIVIPAETAFGTGQHATTALCLRMLERLSRQQPKGWAMLDAGTGTGILAIAGGCLGAARVLAIDNDPVACTIARRNARVNRARDIEFRTGDILKQKFPGKFDVITANLFSEILISALPGWTRYLASTGYLILSGILRSQEKTIVAALQQNRCAVQEIRRRGKWIAVLAYRRTALKAVPACKRA